MPDAYLIVTAAVAGAILGSFATVVVARTEVVETEHGGSLAWHSLMGRSRCPSCGRTITAIENVPLLSYLALRGRCRGCGTRISSRYPLMEATTALLFGLTAWRFGASVETPVYAAFFWVLVVLTFIDLEHKLLPDRIVFPAAVAGWAGLAVAAVVDGRTARLGDAGLGALIFGGFLFVVAFAYPAGMGGGDVKLAFVLGSFLGYLSAPGHVLTGMFLSFVAGGVIGLVAMAVTGRGRKTEIPFGPFLALGTAAAVFWGRPLLEWYL